VAVKKRELPPNPLVNEILEAIDSERVRTKKVDLIKTHCNNDGMKMLFIWNFDESVISMLPEGPVPYQPVDGDQQADPEKGMPQRTTIRNGGRQFYRFVKGGDDSLNKIKRESMFINLLETLHQEEAEILILVKDKQLGSKYGVTKELVAEAFPEITWGNRS
tara:strand:+ start:6611 stop:7096 length:486 start_codon:yes stop_codon:yes gene_type:complete